MKSSAFSLQYGSIFYYPRKVFKNFLGLIYPVVIRLYPLPEVASIPETIDKIIRDNSSICRFGDGELLYVAEKRSLPFQRQDERLRQHLIKVLQSNKEDILIGLPIGFYSLENLEDKSKLTWKAVISWTYPRIKPYLDDKKKYYNASITRLYMHYADTSMSGVWFKKVRSFWTGRDVVLFEGEKSRLGVGNNLFENAKSVKRVLGPAHHAYDRFDELLNYGKKISQECLILVAMGPTAKPLCFELATLGYQCLDIGNLDVEYEWFLRGATHKIKIPGKYTSEAKGGRDVENLVDEKYSSQIIESFL